jgi:hypothetical protein
MILRCDMQSLSVHHEFAPVFRIDCAGQRQAPDLVSVCAILWPVMLGVFKLRHFYK